MLSGGELRRLSLAILVASGANVLILDEPTNHLDVESREALEDALRAFDGAVILVSHDRALLDAVGTRTIALEDGKLSSYPGGWADYMRVREERRAAEAERPSRRRKAGNGRRRAGPERPSPPSPRTRSADRETWSARSRRPSRRSRTWRTSSPIPGAWATPDRSAQSTERHEAAKRNVENLYEELAQIT